MVETYGLRWEDDGPCALLREYHYHKASGKIQKLRDERGP